MKREEKYHSCLYCYFKSKDVNELKKHEEYLHGCYRDINPRKVKPKRKESIPFNPEEVYRNLTLDDNDTIIEGKLSCVKFDDKGRKIPLNRQMDIWYIYDANQHKYRMYTHETKYGDYKEIVYSDKTGTFSIKDIKKLREDWQRTHGEEVSKDVDKSLGRGLNALSKL